MKTGALLLLTISLLLAGCVSRPLIPAADLPDELAALDAWNLQGRMGYRSGKDGGSAAITWQQRKQQGRVLFSGPVGIGSAELHWSPGTATLATGKDKLQAPSTETLADHLLGVPVSLETLGWWVRGLPAPHTPFTDTRNDQDLRHTLHQDGWHIEYGDYRPVHRWQLPHRIRVRDDNRSVNLVIRSWEPLP